MVRTLRLTVDPQLLRLLAWALRVQSWTRRRLLPPWNAEPLPQPNRALSDRDLGSLFGRRHFTAILALFVVSLATSARGAVPLERDFFRNVRPCSSTIAWVAKSVCPSKGRSRSLVLFGRMTTQAIVLEQGPDVVGKIALERNGAARGGCKWKPRTTPGSRVKCRRPNRLPRSRSTGRGLACWQWFGVPRGKSRRRVQDWTRNAHASSLKS